MATDANEGKGSHSAELIGSLIRERRTSVSMSVRALARLSGFSASFISQVEHGQASPSIASLEKIALALGLTLGSFFASRATGEASNVTIMHAGEGQSLLSEWSLATFRKLGSNASEATLESLIIELAAGGRSGHQPAPRSMETFAFVVAGTLMLHLPDVVYPLGPGDSATVPIGLAHCWTNESDQTSRLLMISDRQRLPTT